MSCCFGEEEDPREKLRNAIKAGAIRVTVRQDTFQHVSHMDAGDSKPHPLGGVGSPLNLKALDTETYNHVRSLQEYAAGVLRNDTYPSTLPPAIPSQAHLSPSSGAGGAGRRSLSRDRGGEHHYTSSGSLTAASPLRETRYGRGSKDGSGSGGDSSSPTSTENGTESSLVNGNAGVYAMTSISKQNGSSYPHQHPGNEPSWDASTSTATGTTTLARMRHSVFPMEATGDAMLSVRALDALGTQSVTLGSFHAANAAELAPEERPLSPEQPDPVTSHVLPSTTTPARPISPSAESTITTTTTNNPYPLRSSSAAGSTSADLTRSPSILSGPSTYSSVAGSYASTMGAGGQATRQQQSGSAVPSP
ncbi:hypothetical protein M427DRAFT_332763 [Gonapodya prolifera JEL478]|uniref:CRIB domain-containing protein n=1 Tax=Gonapodya prolifera (strain JEL478) TaxID=1344416 RepID=A0A139ADT9_GONPJ|nr:hypothetical protein M427DRAFT_332763 [Gonapodya prolifera JEL478]|eukprot:KXS14961.1 hypothetical protein M427DRAFT_332763 [Gonapodya prolifera JEL478]